MTAGLEKAIDWTSTPPFTEMVSTLENDSRCRYSMKRTPFTKIEYESLLTRNMRVKLAPRVMVAKYSRSSEPHLECCMVLQITTSRKLSYRGLKWRAMSGFPLEPHCKFT